MWVPAVNSRFPVSKRCLPPPWGREMLRLVRVEHITGLPRNQIQESTWSLASGGDPSPPLLGTPGLGEHL